MKLLPLLFSIFLVSLYLIYNFTYTINEDVHVNIKIQQKSDLDVVVIASPTDTEIWIDANGLQSMRKHIVPPPRRIVFVSSKNLTNQVNANQTLRKYNAEFFDEKNFPFRLGSFRRRQGGWIFQQFLKFYVFHVIPNLSSNVLIIDSDVVFIRDHQVLSGNRVGHAIVSYRKDGASDYDISHYKNFFGAILPGLSRPKHMNDEGTAISHMMIFQEDVIKALHLDVKKQWNLTEFYEVMKLESLRGAPFSEYELYHAYVSRYFPDRVLEVKVPFLGAYHNCSNGFQDLNRKNGDIVFMACHRGYRYKPAKPGGWGAVCVNSKTSCCTREIHLKEIMYYSERIHTCLDDVALHEIVHVIMPHVYKRKKEIAGKTRTRDT